MTDDLCQHERIWEKAGGVHHCVFMLTSSGYKPQSSISSQPPNILPMPYLSQSSSSTDEDCWFYMFIIYVFWGLIICHISSFSSLNHFRSEQCKHYEIVCGSHKQNSLFLNDKGIGLHFLLIASISTILRRHIQHESWGVFFFFPFICFCFSQ